MLIRYKCPNCTEWHNVGEIPAFMLPMFMRLVAQEPLEPFTSREWCMILATELARRNRG